MPGVTSCSVSLLTNSMGVEGTASSSEIIAAVQTAGYGGVRKRRGKSGCGRRQRPLRRIRPWKTMRPPVLKRRDSFPPSASLSPHAFFHGTYDVELAASGLLHGNHVAMGLLQLLLTVIVMVINQKFLSAALGPAARFSGIWTPW